jgi:hypothetical protein
VFEVYVSAQAAMALAAGEKDGGEGKVASWASSARCSKTRSKTLEDHFVKNQRISALWRTSVEKKVEKKAWRRLEKARKRCFEKSKI